MTSLAERLVSKMGAQALYGTLSPAERRMLRYEWRFWARETQLPPLGDWLIWFFMAGRGAGKSRAGAEYVRAEVEAGRARQIALVADNPADVRDVMVEGSSGLRSISPVPPTYEPTKRKLTWPNGAFALTFSSYEPDQLRGPEFDLAWCDEIGKWKYPTETWDNLMLALRIGRPRCVAMSTPRPIALIRRLLKDPSVAVTKDTTYANRMNLAPTFMSQVVSRYEGTHLGRQEIHGELLEETPGALWKRAHFQYGMAPDLDRVVVGVDPSASSGGDETGIIVAGRKGDMRYVLDDRSVRASPLAWARRAIAAYHDHKADKIVAEANQGGEMVFQTLRTADPSVPVQLVHASRGKRTRAEPIVSLYEQGKVVHVRPFPELEDQCCMWVPDEGDSPDRMDALVWALAALETSGLKAWV